MRKISILATLILICISNSFGQTGDNSIVMTKGFGGYQFYQHDSKLSISQLVKTMESNEQAHKQIKSAQTNNTFATIIGGAGGFMVGYPLGAALGGGDPNWTMAGIGAGLIVVSIPLTQKFNKQAKAAVDTYNNDLQARSFLNKKEVNLGFSGNGLGLRLTF